MNTVICEAQSWGRPVVATRVGGNGDMIRDGHSGLLCEPGDVEALRDRIERLLADDALCEALGRRGFESLRQFTLERHLDSIQALYDEIAPLAA